MTAQSGVLPAFYIPHGGGPCFFMEWDPKYAWASMERFLRGMLADMTAKPKAILVISAHWEEEEFTLTAREQPPLFYDYYGFPEHTYRLKYPAPGAPALASRTAELLRQAGISAKLDAVRGFDHGVFIPFLLIAPHAEIPLVQLSLKEGLDAAEHIRLGEALVPLRRDGVLLVGSGMSYHNLRQFGPQARRVSENFDQWLTDAVKSPAASRNKALSEWEKAPSARAAHPREEHLIPLMVIAGTAGQDIGEQMYTDHVMGMAISAYRFGSLQ